MYRQYLRPLTSAVAHVVVGSFSVCQPLIAACIVPAPPTAAFVVVMPGHKLIYDHIFNRIMANLHYAFCTLRSLI